MVNNFESVMAETIQRKIKSLIPDGPGVGVHVGQKLNSILVEQIIDQSIEYPDSITLVYEVFGANGKCIRRYENCSLIIYYEVE